MSTDHSKNPIPDELLSAYLDGELSAEEGAGVEARLAADSAARQLLAELRAVSQAVRELPAESADATLRSAVLERIENSQKASTVSATDATIPMVRPRRAWMWTAAAIAASILVVMAFSDRFPSGRNVREVALETPSEPAALTPSDKKGVADLVESSSRQLAPTSGMNSGARGGERALTAEFDVDSLEESEWGRGINEGLPEDSVDRAANVSQPMNNLSKLPESASGAAPTAARASGRAESASQLSSLATSQPAAASSEAAPPTEPAFMAHVVMSQVAYQAKDFEAVLRRNSMVPEESADTRQRRLSRSLALAATEDRSTEEAEAGAAPLVEVIGVRAPRANLESCFREVENDPRKFPVFQVFDPRAADQLTAGDSSSPVAEFLHYNRVGPVPESQMAAAWQFEQELRQQSQTSSSESLQDQSKMGLSQRAQSLQNSVDKGQAFYSQPQAYPYRFNLSPQKLAIRNFRCSTTPADASGTEEMLQVYFYVGCQSTPNVPPLYKKANINTPAAPQ